MLEKVLSIFFFNQILGCPVGSGTNESDPVPIEKSSNCPQLACELPYKNCHRSIDGWP